jgi:hypothetical protein
MKRWLRWAPETGLCALLAALLLLLLSPWKEHRNPIRARPVTSAAPAAATQPSASLTPLASPRQIAALFGWREPSQRSAAHARSQTAKPEEASWIRAVGYVVEQNGIRSYVFKDTRSGAIFSLKLGAVSKGWKLLEVREQDYLLEFEGKAYIIRRKP